MRLGGGPAAQKGVRQSRRRLLRGFRRAGFGLALLLIALGSYTFIGLSRQPLSQNAVGDAFGRLIAVSAAVRVDGRRWNLRIDNAIDVLLPQQQPAEAWTRLGQLERSSQLLKRDVQVVDMRLPDRLVLRVHAPPPPEAGPSKKPRGSGKSA